jgi:hypothetical protein
MNAVEVIPSYPLYLDVSLRFQVCDNIVDSPFGEFQSLGNFPRCNLLIPGDTGEGQSVISDESPL